MAVNRPGVPVLACVAVLGTACAGQPQSGDVSSPSNLGPPVVREGVIYTPVSVGPQGCVLYNVQIAGGQAPAALVYRSLEGGFTYERPERCVEKAEVP